MQMVPVSSSNLSSVGYDETSKTLRIAFHNGVYEYYSVPHSVYSELLSASSKGTYHHNFIKNSYSYSQVG